MHAQKPVSNHLFCVGFLCTLYTSNTLHNHQTHTFLHGHKHFPTNTLKLYEHWLFLKCILHYLTFSISNSLYIKLIFPFYFCLPTYSLRVHNLKPIIHLISRPPFFLKQKIQQTISFCLLSIPSVYLSLNTKPLPLLYPTKSPLFLCCPFLSFYNSAILHFT